ncbi:MAG: ABC transporter permease [Dehalococcoidales bacterium]|nr:ABC transporter permease [Dehalococcoidales bacterium]
MPSLAVAEQTQNRGRSLWAYAVRRFLHNKKGMICLTIIILLYGAGILAAWIAPYHYDQQNLGESLRPPSIEHPFGTDRLGRDVFSRILFGIRTTVIVTLAAMITGGILPGIILGLISGYFGKIADTIIMRIGEIFLAFPDILLVILIAATLKPRVTVWVHGIESATGWNGIVRSGLVDYMVVFGALAIVSWVGMARVVRGQVLSLKQSQYILAARALGASHWRIIFNHIFPNLLPPIIVLLSVGMGSIAGSEVMLSWLGLGVQPPVPSLGLMIWDAGDIGILRSTPHLILFPVITVAVIIFAFNLLGDALNDALNPKIQ